MLHEVSLSIRGSSLLIHHKARELIGSQLIIQNNERRASLDAFRLIGRFKYVGDFSSSNLKSNWINLSRLRWTKQICSQGGNLSRRNFRSQGIELVSNRAPTPRSPRCSSVEVYGHAGPSSVIFIECLRTNLVSTEESTSSRFRESVRTGSPAPWRARHKILFFIVVTTYFWNIQLNVYYTT